MISVKIVLRELKLIRNVYLQIELILSINNIKILYLFSFKKYIDDCLIYLCFLYLFLILIFGLTSSKLLKIPASFTDKLLLGLVTSNTLASIASIIVPLNTITSLSFLGIAITLACFFIKDDIKTYFYQIKIEKKILLSSAPFFVIAFCLALSQPGNYDTSLYHLQTIKWIEAYPVVPGLANLHGRLGFNNNCFTLSALTSCFQIFQQEIYSVNLIVFCIMTLYFVRELSQIHQKEEYSSSLYFNLFIFLRLLTLDNLASPSPDFLATIIPLYVYSKACNLIQKSNVPFKAYIPILILTVYALTIKLSVIPLIIINLFILWKYRENLIRFSPTLLLVSLLIVTPWVLRNIILTGWAVYPFKALDLFNFDWKVPVKDVIFETNIIKGAGRILDIGAIDSLYKDFTEWFPLWCKDRIPTKLLMLGISLVMPIITLTKIALQRSKENTLLPILFCVSGIFGLIFWFLIAPAWRFGEPFILLAGAAPILAFKTNDKESSITTRILLGFYCTCVIIYDLNALTFIAMMSFIIIRIDIFSTFSKEYYLPGSWVTVLIMYAIYAKNNIQPYYNGSFNFKEIACAPPKSDRYPDNNLHFNTQIIDGQEIYEPEISDRCYGHPIPCTGYANENNKFTLFSVHKESIPKKACLTERIELRGNTLAEGFRRIDIE